MCDPPSPHETSCPYTQTGIYKERPASVHVNQQVHLDLLPMTYAAPQAAFCMDTKADERTAPCALAPLPLLRLFSPQAGNCANLVPSLGFQQDQAISSRRDRPSSKVRLGLGRFNKRSLSFPVEVSTARRYLSMANARTRSPKGRTARHRSGEAGFCPSGATGPQPDVRLGSAMCKAEWRRDWLSGTNLVARMQRGAIRGEILSCLGNTSMFIRLSPAARQGR